VRKAPGRGVGTRFKLIRQLIAGLRRCLDVIAKVIVVVILLTLGLIVIGVGTIFWMVWHPDVFVPLDGTDLAVVYRNYENRPKHREYLALAEKSAPGKMLAEAAWFVDKEIGVDIWRTPDRSSYYLFLRSALFRIDVANRTLRYFEFPQDTCPSDATSAKWSMQSSNPSLLRPRPADLVFVGSIRKDEFTPAERLPPPPPRPRRNCAAEALAWNGNAFTMLEDTDLTIGMQLRWLPGDSLLYEISVASPKWASTSPNGYPPPRTTAMPPRVRVSLYREGGMVHLIDDGEAAALRHMRLSVADRNFGESAPNPSCRLDAARTPREKSEDGGRSSRFFDGWVWLGRFEAQFEPLSDGRWSGRLLFLTAAEAQEDVLAPERFCKPRERWR
jgi:hypothetical protein